jgi:hypothetical protein
MDLFVHRPKARFLKGERLVARVAICTEICFCETSRNGKAALSGWYCDISLIIEMKPENVLFSHKTAGLAFQLPLSKVQFSVCMHRVSI